MIIEPKVRGFICTTAHPEGCARHVLDQIHYVQQQSKITAPKRVLVIGSSTGYGLASRIVSAFASGATTIGVAFERPADEKRTASAGWYNTAAFETAAKEAGIPAVTLMGDAFSNEIKQQTIDAIKKCCDQVDLVIYSLASPRRTHPDSGETFSSVLKPIGDKPFVGKTVNVMSGEVSEITIPPATADEINNTVAVMGGDDWRLWIEALVHANVLAPNPLTVAYSYIGPEVTFPIYREGTIGHAKTDLENTAQLLTQQLQSLGGRALVSVNKAVVTQSSAAIPVVPLYISLLFKIMKEKKLHEDCIEQMFRMYQKLYTNHPIVTDDKGLLRLDDWEMRDDVQALIKTHWAQISTDNLNQLSDLNGYRHDFYRLFGFGLNGIDYSRDVNPAVEILSLPA